MPRPHIEFIQSQVLPWFDLDAESARPGATIKVLSHDSETAAGTAIIRYPEGWVLDEPHHVTGDEEFFVLEGGLTIDDHAFGPYGYGCLPQGFTRRHMAAPQGAAVLTFFNGPPRRVASASVTDLSRLIVVPDSKDKPWTSNFDHGLVGSGIAIKFLRQDAESGERTWLLTKGPDRQEDLPPTGRTETHPCVEEFFLLEGALGWPQGMMRPGAYFWRPPRIDHGPGASLSGYLGLFRSREGPFETNWSTEERPRPFAPRYAPVLPASLAHHAAAPYQGSDPY
jgi:hypothetical protein